MGVRHVLEAGAVLRVARLAASCGIRKIRLTGGEPLLHPELIARIVPGLKDVPGLRTIGLTTNGILLSDAAADLRKAGLSSVNISLPSLRRDVFSQVTGGGDVERVLAGIEAALREGFAPVRLNVVVMRGVNDDELTELAAFARKEPLDVRFIEFMPFRHLERNHFVPNSEVLESLRRLGRIRAVPPNGDISTADLYDVEGFRGRVGLISPISQPMCAQCRRLRLTADGKLRACLVEGGEVDVRPFIDNGLDKTRFAEYLARCNALKPTQHHGSFKGVMTRIGG